MHYSRSVDAVIRVYDAVGNVISFLRTSAFLAFGGNRAVVHIRIIL